ncbi:MAG: ABC transporter permease [Spirochaetaceae bacterium]|nr:MAG: ABC transporter permease [Spirochaetaceae bacterium]
MKAILSLIKFDVTNALRDSMVLYILVAPLLLAGGLRLFLPSMEGSLVRYAVEAPAESIGAEFATRLEQYGRVERFESAEAVKRRVLATDDIGGFVVDQDGWRIVLEGNEPPQSVALLHAVLLAATRTGDDASAAGRSSIGSYTIVQSDERSPVGEYAAVGLVMLASLIGGLAVAFAIVDEKEQKVTQAFTVTPLSPAAYFAARGILAAIVGIVVASVGHMILVGPGASTGLFFIALLACAPLPLVVALLVGGIAKNQIQALATLKLVMVVYLTIPFASIVVPRAWHWVFYLLPNYWMFRTFENLYVTGARPGDFALAAALSLMTGLAALALLGVGLGKQLKPR